MEKSGGNTGGRGVVEVKPDSAKLKRREFGKDEEIVVSKAIRHTDRAG